MSDNDIIKVKVREIPLRIIKEKVWAMLALFHFPAGWGVQSLHNDIVQLIEEFLRGEEKK